VKGPRVHGFARGLEPDDQRQREVAELREVLERVGLELHELRTGGWIVCRGAFARRARSLDYVVDAALQLAPKLAGEGGGS
jgi:hypothetical protein